MENFSVLNSSRFGGILHIHVFKFREKIKQSTIFFVFSQEIIYIKWFTTCTCILPPNILGFCDFFLHTGILIFYQSNRDQFYINRYLIFKLTI